ncbi:MAG: hypothetical protein JNK45_13625 [Myxococcales bacterium]|nr:hypothetical protein [Myxococcales bacterium]
MARSSARGTPASTGAARRRAGRHRRTRRRTNRTWAWDRTGRTSRSRVPGTGFSGEDAARGCGPRISPPRPVNEAAAWLVRGGEAGIFTPMLFFHARRR